VLRTIVALLALGVLAAGCGGDVDERPASWGYISPAIFQPSCATPSCHSQAAAVAGLDFSDPHRGYASLTRLWVWVVDPSGMGGPGCGQVGNMVVCDQKIRPLVTPYDPAASRLVNVLRARNAPRMPPDRPLVEADIRLVERWILNGALGDEAPAGGADGGDASNSMTAGDGATDDGAAAAADGATTADGTTTADGAAATDGPTGDGAGNSDGGVRDAAVANAD
jgi:hypothetical protein